MATYPSVKKRQSNVITLEDYTPVEQKYEDDKLDKVFDYIRYDKRRRNQLYSMYALAIFSFILSITAVAIGITALSKAGYSNNDVTLLSNQQLPNTPFNIILGASAAPLAITLPNDLSSYKGAVFTVYSATAQPHTITILAGTLSSTWDGTNNVATFGGAIGDGLQFRVIDNNRIAIIGTPTNVVFS